MRRDGTGRQVAAVSRLRVAMAMDATGLLLLTGFGVWLAHTGRTPTETDMLRGLQIVMVASLIGCVVTADKAVLQLRRTVVMDILGAGTWALAVVLIPVAMIQRLDLSSLGQAVPVQMMMLVWLSLHGAVGVVLAGIALHWRKARTLRWLNLWQRWLAVTGVVVLLFPYVLAWVAG